MENTETQEKESHSSAAVIGALLVGSILGAGLGLLFAPDHGENTRKKLWEDIKDTLKDIKCKHDGHCPGCTCKKEEETEAKS